jgi:ribosomal protein L14E/L6E/L27E
MKACKGLVVKANAGRDFGRWFIICDIDNEFAWIADGKTRKLASPKKKNIKHLKCTNTCVDTAEITDKKLRVALKQFYEK